MGVLTLVPKRHDFRKTTLSIKEIIQYNAGKVLTVHVLHTACSVGFKNNGSDYFDRGKGLSRMDC
jgi:hypothetical protein